MYRPLLRSTCIYTEDNRYETLCRTIIDTVKEKAMLLGKWKKFHKDQFGPDTHNIPDSSELCLYKMCHRGSTRTDTCNSAHKISSLLAEEATKIREEKSLEKGEYPTNVIITRTYFRNHLRNVWIGAITKRLSKYLDEILAYDL